MDKISIMGVRIDNVSMTEAMRCVEEHVRNKEQFVIYTPNTEFIMMCARDDEFMDLVNRSDINVPDGVGLIYASRMKRHPLKEKVAGFDLSVNMLKLADKEGLRLYGVGGKPNVAQTAMQRIKEQYPGIQIAGSHHGYFKGAHLGQPGHSDETAVIDEINAARPDILFVGLGAKKQELWVQTNRDKLNASVIICNGGTMDVLAGNVKRAPDIFIKLGFEWLYRLVQEPSRVGRQMALPVFMLKVIFGGKEIVHVIE